jgi:hypothetical protein
MARRARALLVATRLAVLAFAVAEWNPPASLAQGVPASNLKAAFTLNFLKFTTWPNLQAGPLVVCVSSENNVFEAMTAAFAGQSIDGRSTRITRVAPEASVRDCQLLYISERDPKQFATTMDEAGGLPMLTISDADRSSKRGAIVELFTEDGRLRFAINIDTLDRSRLKMSSRLLALARPGRTSEAS